MAADGQRRYRPTLHDRLLSLAEDVELVQTLCNTHPQLAPLPNLRCGGWYTHPNLSNGLEAYFKSTDGHTGEWDFNLRRANMHLLPVVQDHGGLIVVDATRRGKRYPDALSKTVPLWCATINRALVLRRQRSTPSDQTTALEPESGEWTVGVQVPESSVGLSERWDIDQRVQGWAEKLLASSLPLPELKFPLQPVHLSPSSLPFTSLPLPEELGYHPIICFSASKCITSDEQRQRDGWRYEQGAGDDHELWGSGLEATDFWRLIEEEVGWETWSNEELEQVIGERLRARVGTVGVERETEGEATVDVVRPTGWIHLSILPLSTSTLLDYACIILSSKISPSTTDVSPSTVLEVKSKPPKSALPSPVDLQRALTFARSSIQAGKKVVVACENGKDASVGVGLVLLQGLFSTDGRLLDETHLQEVATKQSLSNRLQWIINARPKANPNRKTLQHVNQFFMSGEHRPSKDVCPEP